MSTPKSFVSITRGISGWFAVQMWWNPSDGGFWEPWTTGEGRFATREEAIPSAFFLAAQEDLEVKL